MNRIQIDSTRSKSKITVPGKRTTTKTTNATSEESAIDLEMQIRCRLGDQLVALEGYAVLHPRRQEPTRDGDRSDRQAAPASGGLHGGSPSGQLFSLSRNARFDDRGGRFGKESGRPNRRATGRTRDQPAIRSRRDGGLRGTVARRGAREFRSLCTPG